MNVLLIGSDIELLHMTKKLLSRHNYCITCAASLDEAADALKAQAFPLVVADCELQRQDLTRLLTLAKPLGARVLCISSNGEDEVPCLNAGADDWMKKPYQVEVLLARMSALLRHPPQKTP